MIPFDEAANHEEAECRVNGHANSKHPEIENGLGKIAGLRRPCLAARKPSRGRRVTVKVR